MILLNFDLEEFDLPLEHHVNLSLSEQIEYSKNGVWIILDLLEKYKIKSTFFCTSVFAINATKLIQEICSRGHEIASHGYSHSTFINSDISRSKQVLQEITGKDIKGYRMARMRQTDMKMLAEAGYLYDSSINPTFIPHRYNNLNISRTLFMEDGVWEVPASVSPGLRLPLFWLSLHNLPFGFYTYLCRRTLKKDKYLNIYFHSWELSQHLNDRNLNIPFLVRKNSGNKLLFRLERFIQIFLSNGESFKTMNEFINENNHT